MNERISNDPAHDCLLICLRASSQLSFVDLHVSALAIHFLGIVDNLLLRILIDILISVWILSIINFRNWRLKLINDAREFVRLADHSRVLWGNRSHLLLNEHLLLLLRLFQINVIVIFLFKLYSLMILFNITNVSCRLLSVQTDTILKVHASSETSMFKFLLLFILDWPLIHCRWIILCLIFLDLCFRAFMMLNRGFWLIIYVLVKLLSVIWNSLRILDLFLIIICLFLLNIS